eukprot:ANDGO_06162.mRNA.1 hypothetical protein
MDPIERLSKELQEEYVKTSKQVETYFSLFSKVDDSQHPQHPASLELSEAQRPGGMEEARRHLQREYEDALVTPRIPDIRKGVDFSSQAVVPGSTGSIHGSFETWLASDQFDVKQVADSMGAAQEKYMQDLQSVLGESRKWRSALSDPKMDKQPLHNGRDVSSVRYAPYPEQRNASFRMRSISDRELDLSNFDISTLKRMR